jgi:hypothetical protein
MATRWRIAVPVEVDIRLSDEFDHLFEDPGELDQHAQWLYDQGTKALAPSPRPMQFAAIYGEDPAELIGNVTIVSVYPDDYHNRIKIEEIRR